MTRPWTAEREAEVAAAIGRLIDGAAEWDEWRGLPPPRLQADAALARGALAEIERLRADRDALRQHALDEAEALRVEVARLRGDVDRERRRADVAEASAEAGEESLRWLAASCSRELQVTMRDGSVRSIVARSAMDEQARADAAMIGRLRGRLYEMAERWQHMAYREGLASAVIDDHEREEWRLAHWRDRWHAAAVRWRRRAIELCAAEALRNRPPPACWGCDDTGRRICMGGMLAGPAPHDAGCHGCGGTCGQPCSCERGLAVAREAEGSEG